MSAGEFDNFAPTVADVLPLGFGTVFVVFEVLFVGFCRDECLGDNIVVSSFLDNAPGGSIQDIDGVRLVVISLELLPGVGNRLLFGWFVEAESLQKGGVILQTLGKNLL